jgi:hypothetical protein
MQQSCLDCSIIANNQGDRRGSGQSDEGVRADL